MMSFAPLAPIESKRYSVRSSDDSDLRLSAVLVSLRSLRSFAAILSSLSYLCAFASLREIFRCFVFVVN
jgi:hypothetical protein